MGPEWYWRNDCTCGFFYVPSVWTTSFRLHLFWWQGTLSHLVKAFLLIFLQSLIGRPVEAAVSLMDLEAPLPSLPVLFFCTVGQPVTIPDLAGWLDAPYPNVLSSELCKLLLGSEVTSRYWPAAESLCPFQIYFSPELELWREQQLHWATMSYLINF